MRGKHPVFAFMTAALGLLLLAAPLAQADSGSSSATMTLVVPVQTVVSCSSPSVTAAPGANNLAVTCTITGNPNSLASGTANAFGPGSVTLSDGSNNLTANLQSSVSSPDGTVTSITGTSSGFSGSIKTLPAKVQASYSVNTTASTKSGTYTGSTTYTWSTL
jgi:hypothetical protein